MATIRDVANRAGVSPASVTRVIGGYPNVSEVLRGRVLAAVEEVGYNPDLLAAGLRRGTTNTVGVIINDILNPAIAQMVDIIESELRVKGFGVILANSNGDPANDLESLRLLKQRRVDGLIAAFSDDQQEELQQDLANLPIPTVLLDRKMDTPGISAVLTDHYAGASLLLRHFIDRGHREIGLINGSLSGYPSRARAYAYRDIMKEFDLPNRPELQMNERGSEEFGRRAIRELFSLDNPPTAIIVGNGNTGALAGVLGEIRDRRIRIGEDLALAACEDGPLTTLHTPPITTLRRDIVDFAMRATHLTLQMLEKKSDSSHEVLLPLTLNIRESTDWDIAGRTAGAAMSS
jgi:LacI family transcriptional regulator